MTNSKSSRLTVGVIAVAVAILVASGVSVASNMGFKMNKAIALAGTGQVGNNWTSIPYNNPYGNAGAFCTMTGLSSTGLQRATLTFLNESTGAFQPATCGSPAAATIPLIPGKGVQVRQPNITGAPTSLIIVGSHNPALSLTIPDAGTGQVGRFWFAVPYHTTAVTGADLCASIGLTSTGLQRASITRLNGATGAFSPANCGTAQATALTLVLGEHLQLLEPNGPKTFTPAHF